METFNDESLTPDQIKMLTLQFMGQHLTGELKELDKNLISKTNTLKGMALNPEAVLQSIPAPQQHHHHSVPELAHQPVPRLEPVQPTQVQTIAAVQLPQVQQTDSNQNQLEFNFETSPLSERIFDTLERIEKRLSLIEERISSIKDIKKKD